MAYAGWTCSPDPTNCSGAGALAGSTCDNLGHTWSVSGPTPMDWWGCNGTGSCPSASVPPGGGCSQMVVKIYNTYLITCNGSTRACVTGGSTGTEPSPNRTCDNQQCAPGDTTPIPPLIMDVCAGGSWPPNGDSSYNKLIWACEASAD